MKITLPINRFKLKENKLYVNDLVVEYADISEEHKVVLESLIRKGAYASALLTLNKFYDVKAINEGDKSITYLDYLNECGKLLKECVVEVKAQEPKALIGFDGFNLCESSNRVYRKIGNKYFCEDFRMGKVARLNERYLKTAKYGSPVWHTYKVGNSEYEFKCQYWETRGGWGHSVTLYKTNDYETLAEVDVRYYNRTWEMWEFQSAMENACAKAIKSYPDLKVELEQVLKMIQDGERGTSAAMSRTTMSENVDELNGVKEFNRDEAKKYLYRDIVVISKKDYTTTSFMIADGAVYYNNKDVSFGWSKHPTMKTDEDLLDFMEEMVSEGFNIDYIITEEAEGTQCSDIAERKDQNVGKLQRPKKKPKKAVIKESESRDYVVTVGFLGGYGGGDCDGYKDYEVFAKSRADAVHQVLDADVDALVLDDLEVSSIKKVDGDWEVRVSFGEGDVSPGYHTYTEDGSFTKKEAMEFALDEARGEGDLYIEAVDGTPFDYELGEGYKPNKLKESRKTQDFINQLDADNTAKRLAGISGDTMTLDQYDKYQDYLHNIRKNDTSRYDITLSYWDREGYPKEKTYIGRSIKEIARKFVAAKDKLYDFREISNYSDNLYELVNNSTCYDIEEYLESIYNGATPESLVDKGYKMDEGKKPFVPAEIDDYVKSYNSKTGKHKKKEDFSWQYMAGKVDGMKIKGVKGNQIFDINTREYLGDYDTYMNELANVPRNHGFKGFMMNESGFYTRGNYILINESGNIKAVNKKILENRRKER